MAACIFLFFVLNLANGLRLNLPQAHRLKPVPIVLLNSKKELPFGTSKTMNTSYIINTSKVLVPTATTRLNKIDKIKIEDEIKKLNIKSFTADVPKNNVPKNNVPEKKVNDKANNKIENKINEKKAKKVKLTINTADDKVAKSTDNKKNNKEIDKKNNKNIVNENIVNKNNKKVDRRKLRKMAYGSAVSVSTGNETETKEAAIVELMIDYPIASGICAIGFVFCCVCMCCLCLKKLCS